MMLPRLHHASSRLLAPARLQNVTRLKFSNSAFVAARMAPGRLASRDEDDAARVVRSGKAATKIEFAEENEDEDGLSNFGGEDEGMEGSKDAEVQRAYNNPLAEFKDKIAPQYLHPKSCNWLAPDRPFPLNPSFKPPPPHSDAFRSRLYRAYMADPEINSIRALAARHQLSIKRVDAILRLKGMEAAWKKDHTLQTGFSAGMESLLGVQPERREQDADSVELSQPSNELGQESATHANEADKQADIEKARQRYQRLFWETVEEGKEPVMPGILEARKSASASTKLKGKTTLVERGPGRPAIKFVDVGDAFVDEKEKARREREGARRSALKARKRQQALHA